MMSPSRLERSCAPRALLPAALILAACAGDPEPPDFHRFPRGPKRTINETETPDAGPLPPDRWDTQMGGNSSGRHGCTGGVADHYEDASAGESQLHIIGVYRSVDGVLDVHVSRPGRSILILAATEATEWRVTAAPDAVIDGVFVTGYWAQAAQVPPGVRLQIGSYETGGSLLPPSGTERWPSVKAGALATEAERGTGRRLTSFRTCYESFRFDVETPREIRPPHEVTEKAEPTFLRGCESLASESGACMAVAGSLVMFGLDSGAVCTSSIAVSFAPGNASLGWAGDYIYLCDSRDGMARVSIIDGSVDVVPIPCEMVTTNEDGLVGLVSFAIDGFPSTDGVLAQFSSFERAAGLVADRTFDLKPYASRIAQKGDRVYFAWHSTDSVETAELAEGAAIESIPLEGYDDWIMGMDVTDDGRLLIAGNVPPSMHVFDAETGDARGLLPLDAELGRVSGMKCVARRR